MPVYDLYIIHLIHIFKSIYNIMVKLCAYKMLFFFIIIISMLCICEREQHLHPPALHKRIVYTIIKKKSFFHFINYHFSFFIFFVIFLFYIYIIFSYLYCLYIYIFDIQYLHFCSCNVPICTRW